MSQPTPASLSAVLSRIRTVRADGLGVITLARPDKKNALDRQTAIELAAALHELEAADDVRVVIVEGDGDDFCAGADLSALDATLPSACSKTSSLLIAITSAFAKPPVVPRADTSHEIGLPEFTSFGLLNPDFPGGFHACE